MGAGPTDRPTSTGARGGHRPARKVPRFPLRPPPGLCQEHPSQPARAAGKAGAGTCAWSLLLAAPSFSRLRFLVFRNSLKENGFASSRSASFSSETGQTPHVKAPELVRGAPFPSLPGHTPLKWRSPSRCPRAQRQHKTRLCFLSSPPHPCSHTSGAVTAWVRLCPHSHGLSQLQRPPPPPSWEFPPPFALPGLTHPFSFASPCPTTWPATRWPFQSTHHPSPSATLCGAGTLIPAPGPRACRSDSHLPAIPQASGGTLLPSTPGPGSNPWAPPCLLWPLPVH